MTGFRTERKIVFVDHAGRGWTADELNDCLRQLRVLSRALQWIEWYR